MQKSHTLFSLLAVIFFNTCGMAQAYSESPDLMASQSSSTKKSSNETPSPTTSCESKYKPMVEFKAGYFFFSSSKLRKIYESGGFDLQLSGSYPVWKWLQVYASAEYLQLDGKLSNNSEKTQLWEVPLSLGLQPDIIICPKIHYYFTLGPRYIFVHQHNHSPYLDTIVAHSGLGGFINTGFHFYPIKHLLIDVFGEYSYKRMSFHAHKTNVEGQTVQVGGFAFGAGLGYAF